MHHIGKNSNKQLNKKFSDKPILSFKQNFIIELNINIKKRIIKITIPIFFIFE